MKLRKLISSICILFTILFSSQTAFAIQSGDYSNSLTQQIDISKFLNSAKLLSVKTFPTYKIESYYASTTFTLSNYTTSNSSQTSNVKLTLGMYFNKLTVNDGNTITYSYRMTEFNCVPENLNSTQYKLISLSQTAIANGDGYDEYYFQDFGIHQSKSYSQNNPTSGLKYYLTTGWSEFVNSDFTIYTTATLRYQAISGGTIYSFSYILYRGSSW